MLVQDADGAGGSLDGPMTRRAVSGSSRPSAIQATVELDGTTSEVSDVSLEELLGLLEEARRLSLVDGE